MCILSEYSRSVSWFYLSEDSKWKRERDCEREMIYALILLNKYIKNIYFNRFCQTSMNHLFIYFSLENLIIFPSFISVNES